MRCASRSSSFSGRPRRHALLGRAVLEQRDIGLQRVVALAPAVEDQILGDPHLLLRDLVQRHDPREMDDGTGQPAAQRVVEKDRVQHMAGRRVQAEGDVRQAEDDLAFGHRPRDLLDRLQGVEAELAVVLVAGADREGQRVEQQVRRRQAVLAAGEIVEPARHGELVLDLLRHPGLVDRQRDDRGAKPAGEYQPLVGRLLAVLEIDRVDDRLAAIELEGGFEHRVLGRVDDERGVDRAAHAGDRLGHVGDLVAPDKGGAQIERVRAFLDLLAPHLDAAVPVALLLQPAELARAVGVAALADREIRVLLAQRDLAVERGDGGSPDRLALSRPGARPIAADAAQHRVEGGDMLRPRCRSSRRSC